jgi:hypothetical protein
MVDWTTDSTVPPTRSKQGLQGDFGSTPVSVDDTHVWHPRNTEYEIFRTGDRNHTLGAVLILNHRTRFEQPVFPLETIAAKARAEGALIDLEKHNWPWSIALVPLLQVDLFELANNHHWRTEYAITNWAVPAPEWMGLERSGTSDERSWTLFGFYTYYALLNCGFRLQPAAGTANGVHPVPLGFSRVYVHLDGPFTFHTWMQGFAAGRSFVTTGPMLLAKAAGQWPGASLRQTDQSKCELECTVFSEQPVESIELVVNGVVRQRFEPQTSRTRTGAFESRVSAQFTADRSSWFAWRCFETRAGKRLRFAHTAPWQIEVPGEPLRPRPEEIQWLIAAVKSEIARSEGVGPTNLISDYKRALQFYERIAQTGP